MMQEKLFAVRNLSRRNNKFAVPIVQPLQTLAGLQDEDNYGSQALANYMTNKALLFIADLCILRMIRPVHWT